MCLCLRTLTVEKKLVVHDNQPKWNGQKAGEGTGPNNQNRDLVLQDIMAYNRFGEPRRPGAFRIVLVAGKQEMAMVDARRLSRADLAGAKVERCIGSWNLRGNKIAHAQ